MAGIGGEPPAYSSNDCPLSPPVMGPAPAEELLPAVPRDSGLASVGGYLKRYPPVGDHPDRAEGSVLLVHAAPGDLVSGGPLAAMATVVPAG